MTFQDIAKTFTSKDLPDSEIEFTGEIPSEELEGYKQHVLEHFQEEMELPGFRKGHVPLDMVAKRVGDIALLEEQVEHFMRDFYPVLIETHTLDAVGRPSISITKLAPGNPVGIVVRTALYPKVTVPKEWRSISGSIEPEAVPDVLDAEVEEALTSIRRARAKSEKPELAPGEAAPEEALPALDDAFAQSLGNFPTLDDLKSKLRENMKLEKEQKAKEVRRGKIIEKLLEQTTVAVPAIFVESELDKIMSQMQEDVSRFGLSFEEYLKQVKKTEEEVRVDFREQAHKRAKLQLALNKIAADEKVEADKDMIEKELTHAMEHFPDARPELVRIHIETVLRNEKVLQMLEGEDKKAE